MNIWNYIELAHILICLGNKYKEENIDIPNL